jgi:hypothetical protein
MARATSHLLHTIYSDPSLPLVVEHAPEHLFKMYEDPNFALMYCIDILNCCNALIY